MISGNTLSNVEYQTGTITSESSGLSKIKLVLFCLVIFETDGLITKLIGLDTVIGAWLFSFSMICFLFLSLVRSAKENSFNEIKCFYYPILAFVVFFLVSFVSANFIFIKPLKDWLPSLYVFAPIFIFYFLYFFKYSSKEVIWSFILVAICISTLLLVDRVLQFSFLDDYQRRSAFFSLDVRRVVLLKNEVIFGFVATISLLITQKRSMKQVKVLIAVAAFLFFVQAFVMESRMGFLAMGVATLILMYIKGLTKKVLTLYIIGILTVLFLFPIVFAKHIDSLSNMSFHDNESNISIRFETVEHFYHVYKESNGVGIGSMSPNARLNNALYSDEHKNVADAGAYSSLFQWGPIGFFLWVLFTIQCLKTYIHYYKKTGRNDPYSAAPFAFLLAFTFSLLPISFFTSAWCIGVGGVLIYLMWKLKYNVISLNRATGSL